MKKITSLLLAIACVFALVSCGGGSKLEQIVANSDPAKIKTITTIITPEETLHGTYFTYITKDGFTMEYEYEKYADPLTSSSNSYKEVVSGTIYYKDGKYSEDGVEWSPLSPSVNNYSVDLNLDKSNFEEYILSSDGTELISTFKAENSAKVLGRALGANGDIALIVKTNGVYLTTVSISYATEFAEVRIDTSYTYEAN